MVSLTRLTAGALAPAAAPSRSRLVPIRLLVFVLLLVTAPVSADQLSDLLGGTKTPEAPPAGEKVISATGSPAEDKKIRLRLRQIFSELDALRAVEIDVSSGIVTLKGQIDSGTTETKALQLARQVDGVVEVQNELLVNRDLEQRLRATQGKIQALAKELAAGLPLFLLALLVLGLFWLLGAWTSRRQAFFQRFAPNPFIAGLLGQITHLGLVILGLILALVLLDATSLISTILGAAGIIGLAVGFAVRDTVENYLASILLSLRNPFEVNDLVTIEGYEGNIVRLTSRATILISPDGNHIRIPNAVVFKAIITNYTRHPDRRFQFDVGVATEHDLRAVRRLAMDTLKSVTGILAQPRPVVLIHDLGDSNVVLRMFGWVDQRSHDFLKVRSEAIRLVRRAFDEAGIVMPEPAYRLWLHESGGAREARAVPAPRAALPREDPGAETQDFSADRTIENKVVQEQLKGDNENLLNPEAPKEL